MLKTTLIALLLASVTLDSSAALPPKYLGVENFRQCLAVQAFDSYRAWCIPAEKPASCPATSWQQLKALSGRDRLPDCPALPNTAAPSPTGKPTGSKTAE